MPVASHALRFAKKLIAIADGDVRWDHSKGHNNVTRHQYSLAGQAKLRLGIEMDKDTWRLGYAELEDTPLEDWPEGAVKYAVDDAVITWDVWNSQENDLKDWTDLPNQVRAAWALHLTGVWGMRTDKGQNG